MYIVNGNCENQNWDFYTTVFVQYRQSFLIPICYLVENMM